MDNTIEKQIELLERSLNYDGTGSEVRFIGGDVTPVIANGVKIPVRCKDCTYYKQNPYSKEENMMCMCWCDWLATDPDDFCSYGERRAEE